MDIKIGTMKSNEIISLKKSVSLDALEHSSQVFFKTIETINKKKKMLAWLVPIIQTLKDNSSIGGIQGKQIQ